MQRVRAYKRLLELCLAEIERSSNSYHNWTPPEFLDLARLAMTAPPRKLGKILKAAEERLSHRGYPPGLEPSGPPKPKE